MLTRLTNCKLASNGKLLSKDLLIDSESGTILDSQAFFYEQRHSPDVFIDLEGQIIAPGFIDIQLNGAGGFDFSVIPRDMADYAVGVAKVNQILMTTGVTSYLPTIISQSAEVYQAALPFLGARPGSASDGAESLGVHCEGPFLQRDKCGIHKVEKLLEPSSAFESFKSCYGADNLQHIRMITAAPELPNMTACIKSCVENGIILSIGHSSASLELAEAAVEAGASCVTHMFNAMAQPHHRNPGILGLLGSESCKRPYFGIICDGFHVHPNCVKMAYSANRTGTILVTDAMFTLGLPDGVYSWTNGESIEKQTGKMVLVGTDKIAGSCITLDQCLRNFMKWSGAEIAEAIQCVTEHPAKLLGIYGKKGSLEVGADADLVVLDDKHEISMVFKAGKVVFTKA